MVLPDPFLIAGGKRETGASPVRTRHCKCGVLLSRYHDHWGNPGRQMTVC